MTRNQQTKGRNQPLNDSVLVILQCFNSDKYSPQQKISWSKDSVQISTISTLKCMITCPNCNPIKQVTVAITELQHWLRFSCSNTPKEKVNRMNLPTCWQWGREIADLSSPSGSKGAWHHGGASDGSGPLAGEFMLHCWRKSKKLEDYGWKEKIIGVIANEIKPVCLRPLFFRTRDVDTDVGCQGLDDQSFPQHCKQVLCHPSPHIWPGIYKIC